MGASSPRRPWGPAALLSVVVLLSAGSAPAAAACPDEQLSTKDPAATQPRLRAAVVCLVNEARSARGLWSLQSDPQLDQVAQAHTDDMADRGYFEHDTPEGKKPEQRAKDGGYDGAATSENLAYGVSTPFAAVEQWLQSPDHCRNVFSTKVLDIGVGVRPDKDLWTQVFGRRKGTSPPKGAEAGCPASMGRAAGGDSAAPPAPPGGAAGGTSGTDATGRPPAGGPTTGAGQNGSTSPTVEAQGPPVLTNLRLVGRAVRVVAACDGGGTSPRPCRLRAVLSTKVGRRTIRLRHATVVVPAGQTTTLTLRPGAAARRTIARGRGRRVRLLVVVRDLNARKDLARRTLRPLRATFR